MMRLRLKLSMSLGGFSGNCDSNKNNNTVFKFNSSLSLSMSSNAVRLRFHRLMGSAKKKNKDLEWWERFFLDEQGNWFGWRDDFDDLTPETQFEIGDNDDNGDDDSKFQAWKRRAEAITELREAQQEMANQESRRWEDWLENDASSSADDWDKDATATTMTRTRLGSKSEEEEDDDFLYQDRVLRYASMNSAKFLALVILVPWCLDFVVHDYALMPFLERYVKTVPLAAQILDVRREQKLDIVAQLKTEQARMRLEIQIGKCPPLSDDQIWSELHDKAIELRDDRRLENRRAFANIFSDMLFGLSLFLLLYANPNQVALLKFTGYKIINNVSDTGKAFLIILVTDIFLGYHSESGWETLVEVFVEHYGLQADPAGITVFICLVPVIMDACVKLWMFKFLPRLSPKVANIFQEMKRH